MKENKLTRKQQAFVDCYIGHMNATQAYKEAGYQAKNDNVAGVSAHRLLKDDKIAKAIDERLAQIESDRIANATQVLEFLTAKMLDEEAKDADRIASAKLLGQNMKLFTDKVEVDQDVSFEINIVSPDEE